MHERDLVHIVGVDGDSQAKVHQEDGTALFPSSAQQVSRLPIKINDKTSWWLFRSPIQKPELLRIILSQNWGSGKGWIRINTRLNYSKTNMGSPTTQRIR
jgi:hypothetical protein